MAKTLDERCSRVTKTIRGALATSGSATPQGLARTFARARADRVAEILETLAALGQCRKLPDGRFEEQLV